MRQTTPAGTLAATVTKSGLLSGGRSASRYSPRLSSSTTPSSRMSYSVRGWIPARSAAPVRSRPPLRLKALFSLSKDMDSTTSRIKYMLVYLTGQGFRKALGRVTLSTDLAHLYEVDTILPVEGLGT